MQELIYSLIFISWLSLIIFIIYFIGYSDSDLFGDELLLTSQLNQQKTKQKSHKKEELTGIAYYWNKLTSLGGFLG